MAAAIRNEYPRPQMVREGWMSLNGQWSFETDHSLSGLEKKYFLTSKKLESEITVPFCPESALSGVGYTDFMDCVWYKKSFVLPDEFRGKNIILHFGAVDYEAKVWVNGQPAGSHKGGYTPFKFDITKYLAGGENTIALCAMDDVRSGRQPSGKQSPFYSSQGCLYTRTTGIWQSVWLEAVDSTHIEGYKVITDIYNETATIELKINNFKNDMTILASASFQGNAVCSKKINASSGFISFVLEIGDAKLWSPETPNLYDLELEIQDNGALIDKVSGYFGMRSVKLMDGKIMINDKPVFQRLVLDQGYYPDGIYTAPSDEALKNDILISMEMGFNGARMHEKVFEPRYLYWADKLGYLVWGEYANWGQNISSESALAAFLPEWLESVERDFNHPSLIGWCPFNETWDNNKTTVRKKADNARQCDDVLKIVYETTKLMDPTRPVIDTSGNFHVMTDIYDIHTYIQDVKEFEQLFDPERPEMYEPHPDRQKHSGQPFFVSEYGGIWWDPEGGEKGWGYGGKDARARSTDEFLERYKGLTHALLDHPGICAFCYTQLYDVEQEVNGLYTYDRKPKFDIEKLREINTKKAAIEQ